jgi:hypothetical protein
MLSVLLLKIHKALVQSTLFVLRLQKLIGLPAGSGTHAFVARSICTIHERQDATGSSAQSETCYNSILFWMMKLKTSFGWRISHFAVIFVLATLMAYCGRIAASSEFVNYTSSGEGARARYTTDSNCTAIVPQRSTEFWHHNNIRSPMLG